MRTGDLVIWSGYKTTILTEYDHEFVYIAIGNDSAQLVHKSELEMLQ
jgi:hypothetical protein